MYPRCRRDYYLQRSKIGLSSAADAHQYAIALGLNSVCENFEIVNVPAVSHFPIRYRDFKQSSEYLEENGLKIHNVGYNNLIEYQLISRCINTRDTLEKVVRNSNEPLYIVLYGINFAINKAAVDIKHKYPNSIKICNIIPDLPQDVISNKTIVSRLLNSIHRVYFKRAEDYFKDYDSFVLLTKYMNEVVQASNDRYIVSEGIYEEMVTTRQPHSESDYIFTIFYGGMLYEKFGIMNLVKAFSGIKIPNIRLQLCGYGDCVDRVKELSKIDERIQYLGVVSRDKALELQSKASLLVNPRIPDGNPFTRYSFPSKTMEYLASGTPTLLYELDGIPEEYYNYCYTLDADHTSCDFLREKILNIYNTNIKDRLSLAEKARSFILQEKNAQVACSRIYDLLQRTF